MVKVSCPVGVLWVSKADPVAIKLLQERNGQKKTKKIVINYYLKAKEEGQRGYRKRMRQ